MHRQRMSEYRFGSNCCATVPLDAASNTTIAAGGIQSVDSGGVAILATIGGTQFVNQGGVASASLLQNGGTEIVLSGGTTIATVFAGGALILSSGVSPPACPVPSEKIRMFLGICVSFS